jgi:hypothetical protein
MLASPITPYVSLDGVLVFTLTSNGYKYLTYNLSKHLTNIKAPWRLCIICADSESFLFFRSMGISCVRLQKPMASTGTEVSPFGTKHFQSLNLLKLELLHTFSSDPAIRQGVYMDGDIVVYSDFLPDIVSRLSSPSAPKIYLQCDEQTRVDCSGNPGCQNGCTGFIAWSHGIDTRIFKVNGETQSLWKARPEDQEFVNRMMRDLGIPVMTLPRNLYPNGAFASLYSDGSLRKFGTFLLHYNYLVGAAKQRKIKNNGDWVIPY